MSAPVDMPAAAPAATEPAAGRSRFTIAVYAALVILAWVALELWGLGNTPFHTKGEPREGLVVWEMTHGGGWVLPRRNGVELPSKPPLFHWLGALTSLVRGTTDEWSIRFPSAALSLAGVLCVFAAGAALWTPRAAAMSALALMTTFEWARAAINARVDMTLTFGLELAFVSFLFFLRSRRARWLIPLYAGIAFAVLGKGPVGAALPGLVVVIMVAITRDVSLLRQLRLGSGAIGVILIAGSWYVAALILGGWAFFHKQVLAENLFTFLNSADFGGGHRHSPFYLLGTLLLGLLPWTLLLPGVATGLWQQRRELSRHDPRVYLLGWCGVVLGFYSVAASKRSVYLLAMYPAVALLIGQWCDAESRTPQPSNRWLAQVVRVVAWGAVGVIAVVFLVVMLEGLGAPIFTTLQRWLPPDAQPFAPWLSDIIRSARWWLAALLIIAAAALYAVTRTTDWAATFAGVWCAFAVLLLAAQQVIVPGIAQHKSLRGFVANVRQVVGTSTDLFFYKTFDYGAVFYWSGHIPVYDGPWPEDAPRYLLVDRSTWHRMLPLAADRYQEVALPEGQQPGADLVLIRRADGSETR